MKNMSPEEKEKYKIKLKEQKKKDKAKLKKDKIRIDKKKIGSAILAAVLCILMLLSVCGTLLAYLLAS